MRSGRQTDVETDVELGDPVGENLRLRPEYSHVSYGAVSTGANDSYEQGLQTSIWNRNWILRNVKTFGLPVLAAFGAGFGTRWLTEPNQCAQNAVVPTPSPAPTPQPTQPSSCYLRAFMPIGRLNASFVDVTTWQPTFPPKWLCSDNTTIASSRIATKVIYNGTDTIGSMDVREMSMAPFGGPGIAIVISNNPDVIQKPNKLELQDATLINGEVRASVFFTGGPAARDSIFIYTDGNLFSVVRNIYTDPDNAVTSEQQLELQRLGRQAASQHFYNLIAQGQDPSLRENWVKEEFTSAAHAIEQLSARQASQAGVLSFVQRLADRASNTLNGVFGSHVPGKVAADEAARPGAENRYQDLVALHGMAAQARRA